MADRTPTGPLNIGDTFLQKYQVLELLGRGGFGCVYRAINLFMGREVALKVLDRSNGISDEMRYRGQTEAALLGRLEHENLVRVFDAGISDSGHLYLVMELLRGMTLADHLRQKGAFEVSEGLRLIASLCAGLSAAHEINAIHRDLKPANVFITSDRTAKILDFGIAKIVGATGYQTAQNLVVGTSMYISPERLQGHPTTARSDLYALGLLAFEILYGSHPILLEDPPVDLRDRRGIVWWQLKKQPASLHELAPHIPEYVARLVNTALAKRPGQRFASALQMGERTERYRARYLANQSPSPHAEERNHARALSLAALNPPLARTPLLGGLTVAALDFAESISSLSTDKNHVMELTSGSLAQARALGITQHAALNEPISQVTEQLYVEEFPSSSHPVARARDLEPGHKRQATLPRTRAPASALKDRLRGELHALMFGVITGLTIGGGFFLGRWILREPPDLTQTQLTEVLYRPEEPYERPVALDVDPDPAFELKPEEPQLKQETEPERVMAISTASPALAPPLPKQPAVRPRVDRPAERTTPIASQIQRSRAIDDSAPATTSTNKISKTPRLPEDDRKQTRALWLE